MHRQYRVSSNEIDTLNDNSPLAFGHAFIVTSKLGLFAVHSDTEASNKLKKTDESLP